MNELKGVKELWWIDWYDGPINGICEYQGKTYYYFIGDDEEYYIDGRRHRRIKYYVYSITDEEVETQNTWRKLRGMLEDVEGEQKKISDAYWRMFSHTAYKEPEAPQENLIGFTYFED